MNLKVLYQWTKQLARYLPSLNDWQVANLALFSYGVVLAESSQQMWIARKVVCGERVTSAARRLRRFIANEKWAGEQYFLEWSRAILTGLRSKRIYLLVDETRIKDRVAVMMVGLAFESRCIPLVWRCYKANSHQQYPEGGQVAMIVELLSLVQRSMPSGMKAVVLADRGIGTSPRLCKRVNAKGLKYLFRITRQVKIINEAGELTIYHQAKPGQSWSASGKVFKKRGRIPAHVRAIWDTGCAEPWLLVTNDRDLSGREYAQRNWQEQTFRDLKSGGWNWPRSYLRCPQKMSRFLAILALAYTWMISFGSHAVEQGRVRRLVQDKTGKWRRQWSLFKEGLQYFAEYVARKGICPKLQFVADRRLC